MLPKIQAKSFTSGSNSGRLPLSQTKLRIRY